MQKKSFALGYAQIVNWFLAWAMMGFVNASGASLMRAGVAEANGIDLAAILQMCAVVGWIGNFIYLAVPGAMNKIGAKKILCITAIVSGILCALTPFAKSALMVGILLGLVEITTCIFCTSCTMQLVSKWFPRKKATIMGIITAGGILSSLVLLPIYNALQASGGYKTAMFGYGAITAVYGILSFFWLKEAPQEAGLMPDNMPADTDKGPKLALNDEKWGFKDVLSKKQFWFASLAWGLVLLGTVGFITIAVPYMLMHGTPQPRALWGMSLLGVIQFVISTCSGFVDQKIGPVKTGVILTILQTVGFAIVAFYGSGNEMLPILAVWLIMGIFGAVNNLYSSQFLSIFGPMNFAVSFNMFVFIAGITKPLGQMIAGRSLAATGDYMAAGKIYLVCMIIGSICVVLAGDKKIVPEKK